MSSRSQTSSLPPSQDLFLGNKVIDKLRILLRLASPTKGRPAAKNRRRRAARRSKSGSA